MRTALATFLVAMTSVFAMSGCSNDTSEPAPTPAQSNASALATPPSTEAGPDISAVGTYGDDEHTARVEVTNNTIEVYILGDDQNYLYWAGTWSEGDTVVSKGFTKKMDASMLGSQESETTFHVSDDKIEFTARLGDMTRDVTVTK